MSEPNDIRGFRLTPNAVIGALKRARGAARQSDDRPALMAVDDLELHIEAIEAELATFRSVSGGESLTPEPDEWERLRADADRHEVVSPPRGEPEPRLPERFVALRPPSELEEKP